MAEIKGKFITLACSLLEHRPGTQAEALQRVKSLTGKEWNQLEPEGWYGAEVIDAVFQAAETHEGSILGKSIIRTMGRQVYPTIEKTVGFPKHLKTPLDWLQWEGNSFLDDHRGPDLVPRKFTKIEPGHIVVEAMSPGYNCIFIEGVYEGILEMCGIKDYKVRQTHCLKMGDKTCEYEIKWQES